jgi:D-alanine-D-alanine ligase
MKVAVICGGFSMERNISLATGERVYNALNDLGYQAAKFDLSSKNIEELVSWKPDIVYIALHGKAGEDGSVQELLELLGFRYTGPSALSCKLTFDKCLAKQMMEEEGLKTPDYYSFDEIIIKELGASEILELAAEKIGYPLIVKPSSEGSCFGVKLVREEKELPKAVISALSYDRRIIIERYVKGKEITVPIVNGEVFPIIEIKPPRDIFDFTAMYAAGETEYYVPARISEDVTERVVEVALMAARHFRTEKLCRVDIIISEGDEEPHILEINTSPGMTATSLLPMSAESKGISFEKLVEMIVVGSL